MPRFPSIDWEKGRLKKKKIDLVLNRFYPKWNEHAPACTCHNNNMQIMHIFLDEMIIICLLEVLRIFSLWKCPQ